MMYMMYTELLLLEKHCEKLFCLMDSLMLVRM